MFVCFLLFTTLSLLLNWVNEESESESGALQNGTIAIFCHALLSDQLCRNRRFRELVLLLEGVFAFSSYRAGDTTQHALYEDIIFREILYVLYTALNHAPAKLMGYLDIQTMNQKVNPSSSLFLEIASLTF